MSGRRELSTYGTRLKAWRERAQREIAAGTRSVEHGTASTYTNYGCRCDECRAAWAHRGAIKREQRHLALIRGEVHPRHGTESTYFNYKCDCRECLDAHSKGERRRRIKRDRQRTS